MPCFFVVFVVDLLVVDDIFVETSASVDDICGIRIVNDVPQIFKSLLVRQGLGQCRVVFEHLHLPRTLTVALRRPKRGDAQVVVADGLPSLQVVGIGRGFQSFRESLVRLERPNNVQKAFFLAAKHPTEAVPVITVRTHFTLVGQGPVRRLVSTGQNVDRPSNRWNGEFAGSKPPLDLCGAHNKI